MPKTYRQYMETLTAKKNERLASLPDGRNILSPEERIEILTEVAEENSNQDDFKNFLEKIKNYKPEEIENA